MEKMTDLIIRIFFLRALMR